MKRLLCCTLWMGLLVVLAGCNLLVPADTSLISGTPCAPPCWRNITPGESTLADVEQFVEDELLPSEQKTLKIQNNSDNRKDFYWQSARSGMPRSIDVLENRVVSIYAPPEFALTLGDVIERYGIPDNFCVWGNAYSGCCELELYYLQHGLVFMGDTDLLGDDELAVRTKVGPETRIETVFYFEPGDWSHYFIDGRRMSLRDMDSHIENFRSWPGFREFNVPANGCGPMD